MWGCLTHSPSVGPSVPGLPVHPGSRGPLRKLGQKLKRGSQIEPYRLFHSFNGLPFTILIHFRSDKARRKPFGGPFLVLVSNFLKSLVWNPIALVSGCRRIGITCLDMSPCLFIFGTWEQKIRKMFKILNEPPRPIFVVSVSWDAIYHHVAGLRLHNCCSSLIWTRPKARCATQS